MDWIHTLYSDVTDLSCSWEARLAHTDDAEGMDPDAIDYARSHGASDDIGVRFARGVAALRRSLPDRPRPAVHFRLDAAIGALVAEFREPSSTTALVGEFSVLLGGAPHRQREDSLVLAAGIAHDLRAPLGTIRTYATVLSRMLEGENAAQYADGVLTATDRLSQLLDGLLGWVRASSPQPGNADANDAMEQALQDLHAMEQHTAFALDIDDLPPAAMPLPALVQVFQNLLGNAVKHGGRDDVCIRVRGSVRNGEAVYRVADNGCGVPRIHRQAVFDLFQRGDARVEGSGIGLALVRRIVEQYRGSVELNAEHEPGAEFVVRLPLGL